MAATTTYRPSKRRRARKFGFRSKNTTKAGQKILKARRLKGRHNLTPKLEHKF